jgi:hypothetical protein
VSTISDSSPLILLSAAGQIDLMRELFGDIVVPPAVLIEVIAAGGGRAGSEANGLNWIVERSPRRAPELPDALRAGEAQAIALAVEDEPPTLLLLDDLAARRVALGLGIAVTGTAGVVLLAKRRGLINAVRPTLERLREAGLYLAQPLYNGLLAEAGER